MSRSPAFFAMLTALRLTKGNIESLGPAGALGPVFSTYAQWLEAVRVAIDMAEAENPNDPR